MNRQDMLLSSARAQAERLRGWWLEAEREATRLRADLGAENDRLCAALRDLTEVGEPPEGWVADSDGDLVSGPRGNDSVVLEAGTLHVSDGIGVAALPAEVVRYRFAMERARQAQAALDGAPEPDAKSDAMGHIFGHGGRDLVAILGKPAPEPSPEPEPVDPRAVLCKHCGLVRGAHRASTSQCPGDSATHWLDTTYEPSRPCVDATNTGDDEDWVIGRKFAEVNFPEPEPAAPEWDAKAIEATLAKAAAEGLRVRITWHPSVRRNWHLWGDNDLYAVNEGIPCCSGRDRCTWTLREPIAYAFSVGDEPRPYEPSIIAAEIIEGEVQS